MHTRQKNSSYSSSGRVVSTGLIQTTTGLDMTIQTSATTLFSASAVGAATAECGDLEEAARYALLQRLAPAIQHHMMGQFQSMGMITAMIERRLVPANPDLANIRIDSASLSNASQTAVNSIINLMAWIEPKATSTLKFDAGMTECLGLLATQFRFRGFVLVKQAPEINAEISERALHSVLTASLIVLSDLSDAPADLVIRAQATPERVEVSIDLCPAERPAKNVRSNAYRLLRWRDVEALAKADSVLLTHNNSGARLSFARAEAGATPPGDAG